MAPDMSAQAAQIAGLAPGYADLTEAYLLECIIRGLGDVGVRDHKAIAHALFRQFDRNISMDDFEDRVAVLLSMLGEQLRRSKRLLTFRRFNPLGLPSHRGGTLRVKLESMNYYGAKDLAASFRTVRNNTLKIAEEIPEDKYSYRAAEGTRTVGELLTHIAYGVRFNEQINLTEKRSSMVGFDFMKFMGGLLAEQAKPRTKAEILTLLKDEGEKYASALESLSDDFLGQSITMPPGGSPPSRTRFDMLASAKEHEMHHRGQLMLIQRILGITPHLTRDSQARMAMMQAQMAAAQK